MQQGSPSLKNSFRHLGSIVAIGVLTGLVAIIFRYLIEFFYKLFFTDILDMLSFMQPYGIVLLPTLGGLIIGIAIKIYAGKAKEWGVSGLIAELAKGQYVIPTGVIFWQLLAASLTMGSGGSVGPEGPVILMGGAIGSIFARRLGVSTEYGKHLVAAGVAGGIAASFNAPLAGIVFAQEVVLGGFKRNNFLLLALSSTIATYVVHIIHSKEPIFQFSSQLMFDTSQAHLFIILGILAGVFSAFFIKFFHFIGQQWQNQQHMSPSIKPLIGGLLVGLLGIGLPEVLGEGHEAMQMALLGQFSGLMLVLFTLGKALSTSLSLGSGAVGGIFAPTLYLGVMFGGAFGAIIDKLSGFDAVGGFALLGMAAVFAAVFKAPMTAVLMTYELTRNYGLILPIILVSVVANYICTELEKESIYTYKLAQKGMDMRHYHSYYKKEYSETT